MSVFVALPSALAYGVADFAGGLAARRAPVLVVTAVAQFAGLITTLAAVGLLPGRPSAAALGLGVLAGLAGSTGLLLYLRGLAVGPMGVVAPLSAVVGAGLPLVIGLIAGERPGVLALIAIGVALAAIVLATAGTARGTAGRTGLLLGLGAGLGFGLFYIGLDATPADSGLWPLLAGRAASSLVLGGLLLVRPQAAPLGSAPPGSAPPGSAPPGSAPLGLMIVSGVVDTVANVLFLLATRLGDLGVSAVVVSLYPVVVVLLARVVLRERLTGLQLTSAGLALGASVLLAAGG